MALPLSFYSSSLLVSRLIKRRAQVSALLSAFALSTFLPAGAQDGGVVKDVLGGVGRALTRGAELVKDTIPSALFPARKPPEQVVYPPAATPPPDRLVPPPGEEQYFPVRVDGQQYQLNMENTANLTDTLNRTYYKPYWNGEVWAPHDLFTIVEKESRLMATWPDYWEFSIWRLGNDWNRFFERYSGYGP